MCSHWSSEDFDEMKASLESLQVKRTIIEAIQLGCSGRSRFAIISEENVKLVQHAQLILGQDEDAGGARSEDVGRLVLEG